MIYEKRRLITHKVVLLVLLVLGIVLPILLAQIEPDVSNSEAYILDTSTKTQTDVRMDVSFNRTVEAGTVTVKFFDGNKTLDEYTKEFEGGARTVTVYFSVLGDADQYEIVGFETTAAPVSGVFIGVFAGIDAVLLLLLIYSFFSACRVFDYNDIKIVVYSGWYNHYIKFNGLKKSERKTFNNFKAFEFSCVLPDGTLVSATIAPVSRISLKIDNQPYIEKK